ncbi:ABC transporter permease subunit [Streptomyces sp. SID8379]|uniref:carbohydrate ABC transporter permease n=1 Tax=unclassified Streptomyces TaxID=2593676 RepID=UPI00037D88B7|nr:MULTISPECIES: sugar ABC transporter permease [unclassified Streptomyces]MYW69373.1 ABC transporter permease subunit [Streptomyces sp. SID8379]MYW69392.1 ABC transporter permease subunit [Streptomyces sp. SID8379]
MTALSTQAPPRADRTTKPRPKSARRRRREQQWPAYVFLSPWMIGAVVLTLVPMAVSLYLSFTDYNLFDPPHWVGLRNYTEMLTEDPRYWRSVGTTLLYVVIAVPLKLGLALGAAMLLKNLGRGRAFYRSAFYAPSLLGASMSIALVWRALYNDGGTIPNLLDSIGIHTGGWVGNPDLAIYVVVALTAWQFGAPMVIFLAGLQQISPDLYEAAALDGAGRWRQFVSITVPMLSPVVFFNLVLEMIQSFQVFTPAFVVSNGSGRPADSINFYTLYLYERGFTASHMGYAAAMAWLLLIAIGVITLILFRTSRSWVFYADEEGR